MRMDLLSEEKLCTSFGRMVRSITVYGNMCLLRTVGDLSEDRS